MPQSSTTPLASGTINASGDTIEVVLVQPADVPAVIRIIWPLRPTVADPRRYAEVAAAAMPAAGQRVHRAGTAQGGTEGMTDLTIMTTA